MTAFYQRTNQTARLTAAEVDSMFAGLAKVALHFNVATVANQDYTVALKMPFGGSITEASTICRSGTCTATFKVNTTALGGTANAVSSTIQSQAQASANTFVAGDKIVVTLSANASCLDLAATLKITRTIE